MHEKYIFIDISKFNDISIDNSIDYQEPSPLTNQIRHISRIPSSSKVLLNLF